MGVENERRVMVEAWDAPTRVLHWVIAALVILLGLTMIGLEGLEELGLESKTVKEGVEILHAYIGYVLGAAFLLRVIWAFVGNRYARWGDILPLSARRWREIGRGLGWYLGGCKGRPEYVRGHDPLASLFYTAVFIVLASQTVTGVVMASAEFDIFPQIAASLGLIHGSGAESELAEAFEEVHEFGMVFMIFFIVSHLGGLVMHELKAKSGLLSSMVHGRKYFPEDEA